MAQIDMTGAAPDRHPLVIFLIFLRLGLTSFGGPIAHLGYFRAEFVTRRRWLDEAGYADLVALCQFLPGPASSQVGMALGLGRAGYAGALAAWLGFTLPSALALLVLALGLRQQPELALQPLFHGLKVVAVAVIAQAVWGMARQLCPDRTRVTLMALCASAVLLYPTASLQLLVLLLAGIAGLWLCPALPTQLTTERPYPISRRGALGWLLLFAILLLALPWLAQQFPESLFTPLALFYRAGALVFGGGHVVLPLLQTELVGTGRLDGDLFLAGYGAAQAVPGPLFTFAAFAGAALNGPLGGFTSGVACLLALFAPAFLLLAASLPFWHALRQQPRLCAALAGVNAGVVGLLLAALYDPVWTSSIHSAGDLVLALLAFIALQFWRLPPWLVVLGCGVAALLLAR